MKLGIWDHRRTRSGTYFHAYASWNINPNGRESNYQVSEAPCFCPRDKFGNIVEKVDTK
jgi:hypothetical protein